MTTDSSDAAVSAYEWRGLPLLPSIIGDLACTIFSGKVAKRDEIARAAAAFHVEHGGLHGDADLISQVKKALSTLQKQGRVRSTGAYGLWEFPRIETDLRLASDDQVDVVPVVGDLEDVESEELPVERWIGTGQQVVYAYSYPSYRELAGLRGERVWPIKIGMTASPGMERVLAQVSTAIPEAPVIHLGIRCEDSRELERYLHSAHKLMNMSKVDAPGSEWFVTSPDVVIQLLEQLG